MAGCVIRSAYFGYSVCSVCSVCSVYSVARVFRVFRGPCVPWPYLVAFFSSASISVPKYCGAMPPPGIRLPLMKNDGVELTPSAEPIEASVLTSWIAFEYAASKSVTLPTSVAARRTVVGLSSGWCAKNQSFSLSDVPFGFDSRYATEASHDAVKFALGTFELQLLLRGHVLNMNFTSFGWDAMY